MVDSLACTVFLFASFIAAGIVQVAWFKSTWSQPFHRPIDGGRTFRGKPLLGKNKTWRGFVVMPVSVGLFFALFSSQRPWFGDRFASGLWPLSTVTYFFLGCWAGLAFMLGELPNSFCKRQFGVAPGASAKGVATSFIVFILDRVDSLLATLVALSLVVHLPWKVWVSVILVGILVHWFFSAVLKLVGVKPRAA